MTPHLVILDRDGVINEDRADYVKNPGEFCLIQGAAEAIARLNRAGARVAVCSNQSAVGRGIIAAEMLERIHSHMHEVLARAGARLDAVIVCPDPPWVQSACRKPAPGMLAEALRRFRAEAAATPVIGDSLRDLQAAAKLGCPRHLVRTGHGARTQGDGIPAEILPVAVHADLAEAVAAILGPA